MPLLLAIAGFLVGSFLIRLANFLVDQWGIRCPYCQTPYRSWLAFKAVIFEKGRCASCGAPYLAPYALAEVLTALTFVLIWRKFGFSLYATFAFLYDIAFALILLTDLNHRIIPDAVVYPATALAFIEGILKGPAYLKNHLLGGSLSFLLFLAFYALGQAFMRWKSTEEVAFGMGDVKLALLIGLILGYPKGLRALLAGVFLNGIVALWMIVRGMLSKRFNPLAPFPYGPGLIASFFTFWLLLP
jgi:leader peptidase (prepilin peptidase)/N-methyltransferase